MKVEIKPGKYIIAVSGGVDSMVLLDLLLAKFHLPNSTFQFIVAHYDHGMREDSAKDKQFVQETADSLGLLFVAENGQLGARASEATARQKRYEFLDSVRGAHQADGIITAHHKDDAVETMIINMLRGTGRKGLSSLESSSRLMRPLLDYTKADILEYAEDHKLEWVEDATNTDQTYLRNYVRHTIIPKLVKKDKQKLLEINKKLSELNKVIDKDINDVLQMYDGGLKRTWFLQFPHKLQKELAAEILRREMGEVTASTILMVTVAIKTLKPGKSLDLSRELRLCSQKHRIEFQRTSI